MEYKDLIKEMITLVNTKNENLRKTLNEVEFICYKEAMTRENPFGENILFAFRNRNSYLNRSVFVFTLDKEELEENELYLNSLIDFCLEKIELVKEEHLENKIIKGVLDNIPHELTEVLKSNLH